MRKILITGGSRGIGAECVRLFSEGGDRVAFIYRSRADKAGELEKECACRGFCGDVSDADSCAGAVTSALEWLGGCDVLVNCAGVAAFALFQDVTEQMWHDMIETNLGGVYRVTRQVISGMISRKHGRIVNIASMWGETGASCEVHYSAAKAGVIGLTKALAKELAPSGITVNCVSPGAVSTDMISSLGEEAQKAVADDTPVGRLGTPREIADAVEFLARDSSAFITGQVLGVNGGFVI